MLIVVKGTSIVTKMIYPLKIYIVFKKYVADGFFLVANEKLRLFCFQKFSFYTTFA